MKPLSLSSNDSVAVVTLENEALLYTVKPPNKGHFADGPVVPCREVVLFSEVLL